MPPSYPWDAAPATNEPRGLLLDDLSDGGGRSMASGSSPEAPQSAVGAPVSVYRRPEPHPPQAAEVAEQYRAGADRSGGRGAARRATA